MNNYSQLVLQHFKQPQHVGTLDTNDPLVAKASVAAVNHVLQLHLLIKAERIVTAKFKAYGSPYAIAAMSLLTTQLQGISLSKLTALSHEYFIQTLEIPATKAYCAILAEDVLQAALSDYKQNQSL